MADSINYEFTTIEDISSDVASFVSFMEERLSEVDTLFATLLADGWTGAGANAFGECKSRWHTNANQLAATLQTLATKVGNAGSDMHQADSAAAGRF